MLQAEDKLLLIEADMGSATVQHKISQNKLQTCEMLEGNECHTVSSKCRFYMNAVSVIY